MKLSEIFQRVQKNGRYSVTDADIDDFSRAANAEVYLGWSEEWDKRVKGYWVQRWLCTDTWVGRRVYFLDGEPLAVSWQSARKSPEDIEFVSVEMADKCRKFIYELHGEGEPSYDLCNMDEDIAEFYNFDLSDYFLEPKGFVDGIEVDIIERCAWPEGDRKSHWISHHSIVRFPDGTEKMVNAEDIHFPLLVNR